MSVSAGASGASGGGLSACGVGGYSMASTMDCGTTGTGTTGTTTTMAGLGALSAREVAALTTSACAAGSIIGTTRGAGSGGIIMVGDAGSGVWAPAVTAASGAAVPPEPAAGPLAAAAGAKDGARGSAETAVSTPDPAHGSLHVVAPVAVVPSPSAHELSAPPPPPPPPTPLPTASSATTCFRCCRRPCSTAPAADDDGTSSKAAAASAHWSKERGSNPWGFTGVLLVAAVLVVGVVASMTYYSIACANERTLADAALRAHYLGAADGAGELLRIMALLPHTSLAAVAGAVEVAVAYGFFAPTLFAAPAADIQARYSCT